MKSRTTFILPVLLLLVVGTPMRSAEPESGQEASKNAAVKPEPQIAKWISQLDNDKYTVREQATQALTKAGSKAIPAVLKAMRSKQAEIRKRALGILLALSVSDDEATANAVRRAAEAILQSQDPLRVAQAWRILEASNAHRNRLAKQIFRKLGAEYVTSESNDNAVTSIDFIGKPVTDEHMVYLKLLTKLNQVKLGNTKVTDAGLKHLKGLTKLQSLNLWGTNVTDAGLEHLKGMTMLKSLNLSDTDVTGLEHLKGLTNLKTLYLDYTKVTDAGLENLKGLKSLRSLGLTNTNVTDEGVKKLQKALPDCRISR